MRDAIMPDLATLLAAAYDGPDGSITPPIVQTSLFAFDNYQQFVDRMAGDLVSARSISEGKAS